MGSYISFNLGKRLLDMMQEPSWIDVQKYDTCHSESKITQITNQQDYPNISLTRTNGYRPENERLTSVLTPITTICGI